MTELISFDGKIFYEYFVSHEIYELYAPKTVEKSSNMHYKFLPNYKIQTNWNDGTSTRISNASNFNSRNSFGPDKIEKDSPLAQKLIKDYPMLVIYMSL